MVALIDTRGRLRGFAPAPGLRDRERGEGDAAGGLPARLGNRAAGRRRARRRSDPMIKVSDNDAAGHRLRPGRRRGPLRPRKPARHARLLRAGYWANAYFSAADQARFFLDRQARAAALARLRAQAAVVDRLLPALGLLALSRCAAASRRFFKGGWRGTGRRRAGARGGAVRARAHALLDGGADGRQPVARLRARRRCAGWRSGSSTASALAALRCALDGRPAPRPPAAPASSTCTATGLASAWSSPTSPAQPDRAPAARLLPRLGAAARPGRPRPRPACSATCAGAASASWCWTPTARRARHGRSCAGRGAAAEATSWAPTSPAAAATTPAAPWTSPSCAPRDGKRLRMGRATTSSARARTRSTRRGRGAPQPTGAEARDGALRLQRATGASGGISRHRVRALRYLDLTFGCQVAIMEIWPGRGSAEGRARADQPHRRATSTATRARSPTRIAARARRGRRARGVPRAGADRLPARGPAAEDRASWTRAAAALAGAGRADARTSSRWSASPSSAEDVYNAAAVLADGEVAAIYRKMYLPNYGVFDEQRYFQSGAEAGHRSS